jgi:hypothetical protein
MRIGNREVVEVRALGVSVVAVLDRWTRDVALGVGANGDADSRGVSVASTGGVIASVG